MEQHAFTNGIRSLFNIDGYLLPELTDEQQREFVRDPVRYFIRTDKVQQDAIFREVAKRQPSEPTPAGMPDGLREHNGMIEFQCRVCESWTEWPGEVLDYDPDAHENVCGGSPRCCP